MLHRQAGHRWVRHHHPQHHRGGLAADRADRHDRQRRDRGVLLERVDHRPQASAGIAREAEDQRVLPRQVAAGGRDVEREAAEESGEHARQRPCRRADRGHHEQDQVRGGAAGQRGPVDEHELKQQGEQQRDRDRDRPPERGHLLTLDGSTESPGLVRGGATTTPTTPRPVKSTNGVTTAVWVSDPGWLVTVCTVPTGTPATYGRPPTEPNVTMASPGCSTACAENSVSLSSPLPAIVSPVPATA